MLFIFIPPVFFFSVSFAEKTPHLDEGFNAPKGPRVNIRRLRLDYCASTLASTDSIAANARIKTFFTSSLTLNQSPALSLASVSIPLSGLFTMPHATIFSSNLFLPDGFSRGNFKATGTRSNSSSPNASYFPLQLQF
jgi:hypothetical protein